MMTILRRYPLTSLLLFAFVLRLVILLVLGESLFYYEQTGRIHGSEAYDVYAQNILATGVYGREAGVPDATIAPLYSYVVAAVYALFGRSGLAIGVLHSLFDCVTIALTYDIARRLLPILHRNKVALLAGVLTAVYPYLIFQNLTLIDTAFFMLLMTLFIWLMILLRQQTRYDGHTLRIALAAGLVLGLTTLVRALLPLLALLMGLWFIMRLSLQQTFLRLLPVALVSVLVLLPWMWRSYRIYHAFVPVALNTGENLWQGNNPMTVPLFVAGYDAQWSQPPPNTVTDRFLNNQILTHAAVDYVMNQPQVMPQLLWTKFLVHWSVDITPRKNPLDGQSFTLDTAGNLILDGDPDVQLQDVATLAQYESGLLDRVGRPLQRFYFAPLLLLALVGMVLTRYYWRDVSLLWLVQLSMTIMYLIFHPSTRYRVPTDPFLFIFSAYALMTLIRAWRNRQNSTVASSEDGSSPTPSRYEISYVESP